MKPHTFHPEADLEYTDAVAYYAGVDLNLGKRLNDEIEHVIRIICSQPDRFRLFQGVAIRRALCQKFPYSIIYSEEPDRVLIIAVMHAKRKPGYWLNRTA
ncbi:MAG TPA: type II toxin-antitoxin system RelE/ParE family toxin [Verrucomicrobiae bacterium]